MKNLTEFIYKHRAIILLVFTAYGVARLIILVMDYLFKN